LIRKAKSIIIFFEYPRFLSYLAGDSVADKICFIGAGNMAGAIIEGILYKKVCEASDIGVIDISREKCKNLPNVELMYMTPMKLLQKTAILFFCL
jgi:hypothetical protein